MSCVEGNFRRLRGCAGARFFMCVCVSVCFCVDVRVVVCVNIRGHVVGKNLR